MHYYAQLDDNNVCVAVSALSGEVAAARLVPLTESQYAQGDYLGREYKSGKWGDKVPQPAFEPGPSLAEVVKNAVLEALTEVSDR